ncbi:uncharacterized protein LY89DRAFT_739822 [Mollisia scopiformis]|uniref:Uncharacterized protein n=1 Tax=Mollisia scopiformis TaxID=149040 RepID=A0A194WS85_MOLSC|nr:uncharacterized protein LY89DRAFT_739822 [Mollisia scopiformis]KUJ10836.1 hypothetical protein LY89DRAFT_739822 [Mollisia scopiformis]
MQSLFILALLTSAHALPNITSTPLAPGTCQGYPGWVPQPIGTLTQQFFFEARDTSNISLDGLRCSISASSSQLVIYTDPTVAFNIWSCGGNGTVEDIHGGAPLVFEGGEGEGELGYGGGGTGMGQSPEVFTHEVAGVAQDGLFLGGGNSSTWGFELVEVKSGGNDSEYYRMRLLGAKTVLKNGELAGFVRIVAL